MARTRNLPAYKNTREKLLDVGEQLIRERSYSGVGIGDVLKTAVVPKGSFYHYFDSKETFVLEVLKRYCATQLSAAQEILHDPKRPARDALKAFFSTAIKDFKRRKYREGCLMCNLTTELADEVPSFKHLLESEWRDLSYELGACVARLGKSELGLDHLSDAEVGDWLLNSWSGALNRMKATGSKKPLELFMKTIFPEGLQTRQS